MAHGSSGTADMWELALRNTDVLRISTLFASQQVMRYLAEDDGLQRCIQWCKQRAITHVYLESFRSERWADSEVLIRARDRFRAEGFVVSGCITPSSYGRRSTGWRPFSCYTSPETRRLLRAMSEHAAGLFDSVMIDDFLCSDCTCDDCRAAKGERRWADFKCTMMTDLSRTHIIEAGRAVNPDVEFIIKFPAWHEMYQERGYDTAAETALFPRTWVGTETRGVEGEWSDGGVEYRREPQYRAYWLMRWLLGIGGTKCGGGWHDTIDTSPRFYVEQERQSVLGGAPEVLLFNFGAIYEGRRADDKRSQADISALMAELPHHFSLARLIHDRQPRGLLGWKPPNSSPGPDWNLHALLGMAGVPVTAAHEFDPYAPGFVFGCHVLHDPGWWEAVEAAMDTDRPILCTEAFLRTIAPMAEGNRLDHRALRERAVVLPYLTERNSWAALAEMEINDLNCMRDRAMDGIGSFHAPVDVSLYLFGDDVAVVESFRNDVADCSLGLVGWRGLAPVVQMPAEADFRVQAGEPLKIQMPPRSLLGLRRE
jgi:hypothetical protein